MSVDASDTSFSFKDMIDHLGSVVAKVKGYLEELQSPDGGNVDLGTMFKMQFHMQMMSQFVEACSSTLTAVHQEMMGMAKATKGQ
jgi:hypothetical protein